MINNPKNCPRSLTQLIANGPRQPIDGYQDDQAVREAHGIPGCKVSTARS